MKIICVGRNYAEHVRELSNELPTEPVLFLKPETALLLPGHPFFIPEFSNDIHHEVELVVRISKVGKNIDARFANRYYDHITVGIDFTARDIQSHCKSKGLPWEKAKAFDGSAAVGRFISLAQFGGQLSGINFHLTKNGHVVQTGSVDDMIYNVNMLINNISKYFTLKIGDVIFTGTPSGVGRIQKEDVLEGFIGSESLLKVRIK